MTTLPGQFLRRFTFSDLIILYIGTSSEFMLPQNETTESSRITKFLSEVQQSKSSNMEIEIWESRRHVNLWLPHAMIQQFT